MSDAAFTAGPWFAHGPLGKGVQCGVTATSPYDPSRGARRRICLCGSPRPYSNPEIDGEDEANANLIAAAPDMFEALEICLSMAPKQLKAAMNLKGQSPYDIGIAALRKARGES